MGLLHADTGEYILDQSLRLGRCYVFRQGVRDLWASNRESSVADDWSLDRWHQETIVERSDRLPGRLRILARAVPDIRRRLCTSVKNSECQQGDLIFDRSKTRKAPSSVQTPKLATVATVDRA